MRSTPGNSTRHWAKGLDKQDIQVTGFLSTMVGARFRAVLDSISAPRDKDDDRTGSERRIDGFDQLITRILEAGLPSDKGSAQLAGFDSIGGQLLGYITCNSDLTAIPLRGNTDVLDVGRSYRHATLKQRHAVIARQGGQCATPGCWRSP